MSITEALLLERTASPWSPTLIFMISTACLSSLQFGYHMSELNAPQEIMNCARSVPADGTWFEDHGLLTCIPFQEHVGAITSSYPLGGLVGSLFAGYLSDRYGRKRLFLLVSILYFVGSTLEGLANSTLILGLGRTINGLGAGTGLVVSPMFINEISPLRLRGFLGSLNQVSVNLGILFTQLLATCWSNDSQWRLILLMGSAMALASLVCSVFMYESPRWLYSSNPTSALKILSILRNGDVSVVENWENEAEESQGATVSLTDFETNPKYSKSRNISALIMIGQQFCGINSIIFYGVQVLVQVFPNSVILVNCLISVLNATVTFIASLFMDKYGRKPLLRLSSIAMGISSLGLAVGILNHLPMLSVASVLGYVGFFAIGVGPIPFLLISEVSQAECKGLAQSQGMVFNWLSTFLIGAFFPLVNGGGVYIAFALVCFAYCYWITRSIPETKGKDTYEEVWGIS
ncbi:unnamed protein product [Kuraishia capsulata CBS 1993]|uniref:Major facilitator superfamily (MFS) profile domain-containing protein n=1 Tax=Kuraishia capsulata CBS 1993 TaxID=1382522 RepID=W6MFW7_9ASCO|nr:uncharacterized protein KUCA_T00000268001 [Kuraishia capsulata CBS 1993]CDK24308.1 unnamed protein product [Kuraishia capsulata CBS 1993]